MNIDTLAIIYHLRVYGKCSTWEIAGVIAYITTIRDQKPSHIVQFMKKSMPVIAEALDVYHGRFDVQKVEPITFVEIEEFYDNWEKLERLVLSEIADVLKGPLERIKGQSAYAKIVLELLDK
jgi:uncharacterized protein YqfB (UPF0267 family)